MPILDVELIVDPGESLKPSLAQELADAAGEVFGTPRGRTWVRLHALSREHYAENGGELPEDVRPVFVEVLKSKKCAPGEIKDEVAKLCGRVAKVCERPKGNVHILYLPEAAGRMSFGGSLVTA